MISIRPEAIPFRSSPPPWTLFLGHLRPHAGLVAIALSCLLSGCVLALVGPLVIRRVIDEGIARNDRLRLDHLAVLFLGIEVLRTLSETGQTYCLRKLAGRTVKSLRVSLFGHLQRLSPSDLESRSPGELSTILVGDTGAVGEAISSGAVGVFRDLLVLAGVATLLLALHPRFGAWTIGLSLLVGLPSILVRRRIEGASRRSLEALSQANSLLEENIAGHRVIALFNLAGERRERYREANESLIAASLFALRTRVAWDGAVSVSAALVMAILIAVGGGEVTSGRLSLGLFVASLQYVPYLLGALRGGAERGVVLLSGIASAGRILGLLEIPPRVAPATPVGRGQIQSGGELSLSNIYFGYRPGVPVLRGLSARIAPGERVALVGKTGAGKTTLALLLARLYDPWEGDLSMGGCSLREIPPETLRREIAFLTQEVSIFPGSLLENIRLWDPAISREEVMEACRAVEGYSFIDRLRDGFDTPLGPGGKKLSVGERQLLALARVLVRRPSILLLDEPTANIDSATEEKLLGALDLATSGRTSIVIAHRYSTLRNSDRVLVLEAGRIVEEGRPERILSSPAWRARTRALKGVRNGE